MLLGASNLWFPATQSIIVMPESAGETLASRADDLRAALGEKLQKYAANLDMIRDLLDDKAPALANLPDPDLTALVALALEPPPSDEERAEILRTFDPISLLVPGGATSRSTRSVTPRRTRAGWCCRRARCTLTWTSASPGCSLWTSCAR